MGRLEGVGAMELAVLEWVVEHQPVSVREVAEQFAASDGYARTTVQTVMERLRRKGLLARNRVDRVYQYAAAGGDRDLFRGRIREFINHMCGGSVSPFIAYLVEEAELGDEERERLRRFIDEMEAAEREDER